MICWRWGHRGRGGQSMRSATELGYSIWRRNKDLHPPPPFPCPVWPPGSQVTLVSQLFGVNHLVQVFKDFHILVPWAVPYVDAELMMWIKYSWQETELNIFYQILIVNNVRILFCFVFCFLSRVTLRGALSAHMGKFLRKCCRGERDKGKHYKYVIESKNYIYGNYQVKMAKDFGMRVDESQISSFWLSLCDLLAILDFSCQQLWRVTSRQQLDPSQQRETLAFTGDLGNNVEGFVQWSFLIWWREMISLLFTLQ